MKKADRIHCSAPLPEDLAIPLLTRILVPAPYQAPEKKAKEAKSGLRRKGASDIVSEDIGTLSSPDEEEEEEEESNPP